MFTGSGRTELKKEALCYTGLLSSTTVLYWKLEEAAYMLGIDLLNVVKLIHTSNMTKLWQDPDLPKIGMENVIYQTTKGCVVKRKSDGKVIKSPTYIPVNLTHL